MNNWAHEINPFSQKDGIVRKYEREIIKQKERMRRCNIHLFPLNVVLEEKIRKIVKNWEFFRIYKQYVHWNKKKKKL